MSRFQLPREAVYDSNGLPYGGALLYFYSTGTSTPKNTYSDSALATPNANPVVADSAGRFGDIWLSQDVAYKIILKDGSGNTIFTADPVQSFTNLTDVQASAWRWGGTSTGAANVYVISVTPAVTAYSSGNEFAFVTHQANTSSATLNVNSVGAISILRPDGSALQASDLPSGTLVSLRYVSPAFRIINQNGVVPSPAAANALQNLQVDSAGSTIQFCGPLQTVKNRIINGDMRISQRGTSTAGVTTGGYAAELTTDRFEYIASGTPATVTCTQAADHPLFGANGFSKKVTVTTNKTPIGVSDFAYIRQKIEGYNIYDAILNGSAISIQFYVKSPKTGTHCLALRNSGADRSYVAEYTVTAANAWQLIKLINITLTSAGTQNYTTGTGLEVVWPLAAGGNLQTAANTWATGSFTATVNQQNLVDTNANVFAITDVQVELGPVCTAFDRRPYGLELSLCQRYYATRNITVTAYCSSALSGSVFHQPFGVPVVMRSAPTVVVGGTSSTNVSAAAITMQADNIGFDLACTLSNAQVYYQYTAVPTFAAEL